MYPRFLADGHTVLIASSGGAIYSMDTRPEHWINVACAIAGRNLTRRRMERRLRRPSLPSDLFAEQRELTEAASPAGEQANARPAH